MSRSSIAAIATLIGSCLLSGAAESTTASRADLVKAHGLRPFREPTPAIDFRLPELGGGELALSDFKGEWVVLTFWASWCGPCRGEMPSLEALHRELGDGGVAVLGVSLDADVESARSFASEMHLSFPLLWDRGGTVGRDYRASAIPMSYLIDPQGSLVGVATGARDWTAIVPLIRSLASESGAPKAGARYADSGTVALPRVLDPPDAKLTLSTDSPSVGQDFDLEIRLRWAGSLEEYRPQTPKVQLPEGITQIGVRASSDSRDGAHIVVYRVALRAEAPGSYALDPIELSYVPNLATSSVTTRLVGPTVTVEARRLLGMSPRELALLTGGLTLAAALGFVGIRHRRRQRSSQEVSADTAVETFDAELNEIKRLRMQGEARESMLRLIALARQIELDESLGEGGLDALEESVRYGGKVPTHELRDRLQRLVERQLETLRPDAIESARLALRLRSGA
ncbi:MAG: TlpA disulfide reductase family protein [Acidobacteriota bacterium]